LSLNPAKLSGQCGRLKCCLNYELDTYLDALKDIPQVQRPLQTDKGEAFLQKTDIFKKRMWFAFRGDNNWVMISTERVREIQDMNKRGEKPENLLAPVLEEERAPEVSAHVEGNLDRLDDKIKAGKRSKRKKKKISAEQGQPVAAAPSPKSSQPQKENTPALEPSPEPVSSATGGAEAQSELRRPRGSAARPLNRRNNRNRSDKDNKDQNKPEGSGESRRAEAPQPPRSNEPRPPRPTGNPSGDAPRASNENSERNGRSPRRGPRPRRPGGAGPGGAPSTPAS